MRHRERSVPHPPGSDKLKPNTPSELELSAAEISDVIPEVSFAHYLESEDSVITYILKREVHAG